MRSFCRKKLVLGILFSGMMSLAFAAARPAEPVRVDKVKMIERETSRKYIGKITAVDDVSMVARVSGVVLDVPLVTENTASVT